MLLTIQTCSPDVHPSDDEVSRGVDAAETSLGLGHKWKEAEYRALCACFQGWLEWPESAVLVDLESTEWDDNECDDMLREEDAWED